MMIDNLKPRLGLYEKAISNTLTWEEKFCLAWQSGFDFLELSIDTTQARMGRLYDTGFASTLKRAAKNTGFNVRTLALTANRGFPLGSEDATVRDKGLELVNRAVELAAETGIRLIHLAAYDELDAKRNEHTMSLFEEAVRICAHEAESYSVMLALESMDTGAYCGMDDIMKLLREINSPFLGCYADIGNLTATGHDPKIEFEKGKGRIVGIHLKDALPGVCRDVPFGEGIVDFDGGLRALYASGYRGSFVAETWYHDDKASHVMLPGVSAFLRAKLEASFR